MTITERGRARRTAWIVATLVLVIGSSARPAAATDTSRAEELFQHARELMGQNDFATACPLLEESYGLDHGAGTLLALALCHEGNGKPATALREYRESLSLAVQANRSDRVMLAESHVQRLETSVPRVTVRLLAPAPTGLALTLDGSPVDRATMLAGAAVDFGTHELAASAPAMLPWHTRVDVTPASTAIVVDLPALVRAGEPPVAPAPPPSRSNTLGWAVGGLAVVAAGVGGFFGVGAFQAEARSRQECNGSACPTDGVTDNHDAREQALVSDVSFGVAGVALATSLYLLLRPSPDRRSSSQAAGLHAWMAPGRAGVGLGASW